MNVADERDAKTAEFLRTIIDLNCLLSHDEPIGFDEKTPDETRQNQQQGHQENDANCFSNPISQFV